MACQTVAEWLCEDGAAGSSAVLFCCPVWAAGGPVHMIISHTLCAGMVSPCYNRLRTDRNRTVDITYHVHLDLYDAVTAVISAALLVSYVLAKRSRLAAEQGNRARSRKLMLISGALLSIGHVGFVVVGTLLSLEGFYLVNVCFIVMGSQTVREMHAALRQDRKAATAGDGEKVADNQVPTVGDVVKKKLAEQPDTASDTAPGAMVPA